MKRNNSEAAPCVAQVAYKFRDVIYMPHYRNSSLYVGPGYPKFTRARYTAAELTSVGAMPVNQMLWIRANHGIVNEINP
jgi:hypothetical protein